MRVPTKWVEMPSDMRGDCEDVLAAVLGDPY